jgi:hypothetical protein
MFAAHNPFQRASLQHKASHYDSNKPLQSNSVYNPQISTHIMPNNTTPSAFFHAHDLVPILEELDTQADAVRASVLVIQNLHGKYENSFDTETRHDMP